MLGRSLFFDALALLAMACGFLLLMPLCVILCFALVLIAMEQLAMTELAFEPGMAIFLGATLVAAALVPKVTGPVISWIGSLYFEAEQLGGRGAA